MATPDLRSTSRRARQLTHIGARFEGRTYAQRRVDLRGCQHAAGQPAKFGVEFDLTQRPAAATARMWHK